ncbi:feruloyl-CoA synthase [Microbacteriaceae bacterium K1510]|nr:feruloyl-CoA synthase [Microbacteriaceae bacterium K1510]
MTLASTPANNAAYSSVALAAPAVDVEHGGNGEIVLTSSLPLSDTPRQINDYLRLWAAKAPERIFLAERRADGSWRKLSYGEAADAANRISSSLIARGHGPDNPVAALCDNCINMALLKLGAMQVGIPFLPVSPAYSLMSENFAKLKHVATLFTPSLIYVPAIAPFARALKAMGFAGDLVSDAPDKDWADAITFDDLLTQAPAANVENRYAEVGPDSVAKILLTSGSTGMPKGVINTQRMMCANGVAIDAVWPFLTEKPPVIVDWLPWNHTFGTNFNFNQILRHGGTMWIDAGKPVPGKLDITLRNMREIQPTLLYNVPRGFDAILPTLEADDAFARHVFEKLDIIFYAGSALPSHLWQRLDALSIRVRGERIPILSSLGSTETAPVSTLCHWRASESGGVGLPVPGVSVKLVPEGQKLEIRVKGPNITPGYYRQPDLTEKAFDEEGFFKLGDAVRFVDPDRPESGLLFDGRVSENFKLSSGTWVHVGELRIGAISAAAPAIMDAVVTGHDRDEVGLLAFLNPVACRDICGADAQGEVAHHPALHAHIRAAFAAFNRDNTGSSRRIARVLLLTEPPSIDGNEITDKGYINQRGVLERRAALVARLHSDDAQPDVVVLDKEVSAPRAAAGS